jgi:hypothetical protein
MRPQHSKTIFRIEHGGQQEPQKCEMRLGEVELCLDDDAEAFGECAGWQLATRPSRSDASRS